MTVLPHSNTQELIAARRQRQAVLNRGRIPAKDDWSLNNLLFLLGAVGLPIVVFGAAVYTVVKAAQLLFGLI